MLGSFLGMISGWKEIRSSAGFSYQVARNGKRRVVPIEGYRKRGLADQQWVTTGVFADDRLSDRFRNFTHTRSEGPKRTRLAKVDFALNR
jgi:hypothetical protein